GAEQRVVVGLVDQAGHVLSDGDVRLVFGRDANELRTAGPIPATFHGDGIPTKPYFAVRTAFAAPGQWFVAALRGKSVAVNTLGNVVDPAAMKTPVPGRALILVPTPTIVTH